MNHAVTHIHKVQKMVKITACRGALFSSYSLEECIVRSIFRYAIIMNLSSGLLIMLIIAAEIQLTLRLLMSYIYGAPSKARNANVVYIWTYVWQR